MPTKQWNGFYNGVSKDDFVAPENQYIEGKNVTGLKSGYGITLGPKVNKQLLTNGNAPRTIFGREKNDTTLDDIAVGCDTGEIYKLTSADNVAEYTLTTAWDIVNGALLFSGSNFMYFVSKQPGVSFTSASLMQVTLTDFLNGTFASANEAFLNFNNIQTPPMLVSGGNLYVGGLGAVYKISNTGTITTFNLFNRYVTGITIHGTRFLVYTDEGEVSIWDGVTTAVSATLIPGFRPSRVVADGGLDHIVSQDGDYRQGSGYDFSDPITKKTQSRRLEDNTAYIGKFNFTPNPTTGQSLVTARGGLFMIAKDTVPGIYRYDRLISGLEDGFHKTITQNNLDVVMDEIYTLTYLSKQQSKLFFGYSAGASVGVDYIDLDSLQTAKSGYIVTDIATGPPNMENTIKMVKITTSYTSGTKSIKLYKRINNGSWTLFRTITNTANNQTIRYKIETDESTAEPLADKFYDIQLKAVLDNPDQDDIPPIVHFMALPYTTIE